MNTKARNDRRPGLEEAGVGALLALALVALGCGALGCGAERARGARAKTEGRETALTTTVAGLDVRIVGAAAGQAGIQGGLRPDPQAQQAVASVVQEGELSYLEPVRLPVDGEGRPTPLLLALSSVAEPMVSVTFEHRVLGRDGVVSFEAPRRLARFDEITGIWFVDLTALALESAEPADSSALHRLSFFLIGDSGNSRKFTVSLRAFVSNPKIEVVQGAAPGTVALGQVPSWPIVVHRETLVNRGLERARVRVQGGGAARLVYRVRFVKSPTQAVGDSLRSEGALGIGLSVQGATATGDGAGGQVFEIAPGQSVQLSWVATPLANTTRCKLEPWVTPVFSFQSRIEGVRLDGKLGRSVRTLPAYLPTDEHDAETESYDEWSLSGVGGMAPVSGAPAYPCQGVF